MPISFPKPAGSSCDRSNPNGDFVETCNLEGEFGSISETVTPPSTGRLRSTPTAAMVGTSDSIPEATRTKTKRLEPKRGGRQAESVGTDRFVDSGRTGCDLWSVTDDH
ncbi:hypothetical protein [Natrinema gelatinilyticum]|uniref:hypothetical protein n=1 Tax=Natrinema gelatinilyticum TaxID=2961571 RepID=UPI0020C2AD02|nr:hypothetical protein [Natrinema gelatinilyticum]